MKIETEKEIWKTIYGREVSNYGRVRCQNKIIESGQVRLRDGTNRRKRVSWLVAMAFIPKPSDLDLEEERVIHLDKNSENNMVSNLAWAKPKRKTKRDLLKQLRKEMACRLVYDATGNVIGYLKEI